MSELSKLGSDAYDSLKELAEINTKTAEKLSAQQLEILDTCLDTGSKQFSLATEAKDVKDILTAQANLATEYNEKVLAFARNTTAILTESKDEIAAWLEKGVESVSASTSSAPAVAKKAPAPAKKAPAKKAPAKKAAAKQEVATEAANSEVA
jgi:phasin family protein